MTTATAHTDEMGGRQVLADATEKLASADGDVVLDFSTVPRLDSELLRRLEDLVSMADQKAAAIKIRNVNIDVYKVLKLTKLTRRLSFVN